MSLRRIFACGSIAAMLLIAPDAIACEGDHDCPATSRCVKIFGQMHGVCERDLAPVERDPRRRGDADSSRKRLLGDFCQFHSDCTAGLFCVEQGRTASRTCGY